VSPLWHCALSQIPTSCRQFRHRRSCRSWRLSCAELLSASLQPAVLTKDGDGTHQLSCESDYSPSDSDEAAEAQKDESIQEEELFPADADPTITTGTAGAVSADKRRLPPLRTRRLPGPPSITRDDSFDACRAVKTEEEAKALGLSTYGGGPTAPEPPPAAPGSPDYDALMHDLEVKIAEQEAAKQRPPRRRPLRPLRRKRRQNWPRLPN
jgi:hypothetical protein